MQVIKLLVRSCHHWQLKVCKQFYELIAARHAPWVARPTSKPDRPQSVLDKPALLLSPILPDSFQKYILDVSVHFDF